MDAEAIRALVESAVRASTESTIAAIQALNAAPGHGTAQPQEVRLVARKVEVPQFDRSNIEVWIKRVEAAFTRANVTTAKDKFAQMEAKFDVNLDPTINNFLYGNPTDENWKLFLDHLRHLYGRTRKQEAQFLLHF